jgi:hypothetical protein
MMINFHAVLPGRDQLLFECHLVKSDADHPCIMDKKWEFGPTPGGIVNDVMDVVANVSGSCHDNGGYGGNCT